MTVSIVSHLQNLVFGGGDQHGYQHRDCINDILPRSRHRLTSALSGCHVTNVTGVAGLTELYVSVAKGAAHGCRVSYTTGLFWPLVTRPPTAKCQPQGLKVTFTGGIKGSGGDPLPATGRRNCITGDWSRRSHKRTQSPGATVAYMLLLPIAVAPLRIPRSVESSREEDAPE